jgi:hypothetical protein
MVVLHWFLHNPIGQQVTAGLILAGVALVWAAIWKFPKTRDQRRKLNDIHEALHK